MTSWSQEQLDLALRRNPGLRVATDPLARRGCAPPPATGRETTPVLSTAGDPFAASLIPQRRAMGRFGPEDAVQVEIVRMFDEGTKAGRWTVLCAMMANEVRIPRGLNRRAQAMGARLLAMGLLPGLPDLLLLWPGDASYHGGMGFLEVKRPGGEPRLAVKESRLVKSKTSPGKLSDNQVKFRDMCLAWALPWACVRSAVEARVEVERWGALG